MFKLLFTTLALTTGLVGLFLTTRSTLPRENAGSMEDVSPTRPPSPVLVELFTSEGCSSCPPADALLSRLEQTQPIAGAEVIALSEHVDYWNRLGWSDPYSSSDFSARQNQYASAFGTDDVYTPQMIVDGHVQFVGSNEGEARRAITDAAKGEKAAVTVSSISEKAGSIVLAIRVESLTNVKSDDADVMLAITESGLRSNVVRGENAGRVLNHVAVVRKLSTVGTMDSQKDMPFTAQPVVHINKTWLLANLKAVVFVQERRSRRVLGAAGLRLAR
jgi:hypothetical protein